MDDPGKSDRPIVPQKRPNAGSATVAPPAEGVEGRGLAKGNAIQQNAIRAQDRTELVCTALGRVRQVAKGDRKLRFTTLWHHVYAVDRLRESYYALNRKSAPGVDGQTWGQYGEDLENNLRDLSARLQRGAYRAPPVERTYIPKADGKQRPIGKPTLEDKIVQRATCEVLNAIYEVDFKGFSYGFRPGRSQHNALDAVAIGIERKINWVLDADIRGFFDSLDHEWLIRFIEHRIADQRVIRHVRKWLKAGVLEEGRRWTAESGTPQGGSISPLLANVYLHYVLDLWVAWWRKRRARGEVIIVRYADDFVAGFQYRDDAERFWEALKERLRKFSLELHADKTRLIEFGRFARANRVRRGQGKPETFDFLGFTHYCGETRKGKFVVRRQTSRRKMRAKLKAVKSRLRAGLHGNVTEMGRYLRAVVVGHYRYYGIPGNSRMLSTFRHWICRLWFHTLRRRSQKDRTPGPRVTRLARIWLPLPQICHPYPYQRLAVKT
jgi:RNA-directed DNA polymerase